MTTPQLGDNLQPPDEYDLFAQELDVVGPAMSELDEYKSFITQTPIAIDCSHSPGGSERNSHNDISVFQRWQSTFFRSPLCPPNPEVILLQRDYPTQEPDMAPHLFVHISV